MAVKDSFAGEDIEVSVIVPALEATPHVLHMVSLLALQGHDFGFEVLLVLNHAPREITPDLPPRARILFCEEPGSSAARNTGITEAKGRVLAFMDGDVTPHANWMSEGLEAVRQLDARFMVAGAVVPFHERRTTVGVYEGAFYFRQDEYIERGFAGPANLWIPRPVIDAIGLFDETLFAVAAEDFCERATSAGFGLAYAQNAIVYHPTRKEFRDLMRREQRSAGANMAMLRRKSGGGALAGALADEFRLFRNRSRYVREFYFGWERFRLQAIGLSSLIVRVSEQVRVCAGKKPIAH